MENKNGESRIPVEEVIRQLDSLLAENRGEDGEKHLYYWLEQAKKDGDWRGELTIQNELMGYHRTSRKETLGLKAVERGIQLIQEYGLEETVTGGTTYLNGATTLKAFGRTEAAMPYYRKAEEIYHRYLEEGDYRMAGLYNNLGLAWKDMGEFEKARDYYGKALAVMEKLPGGEMELAVTWVNLAGLYETWEKDLDRREEQTGVCMRKAWTYLNAPGYQENGYYAFTCTKCAPEFGHFGYFSMQRELEQRAVRIYGREQADERA